MKGPAVALLAFVAALALSSCRESEMDRTISLEKGTYPGKKPAPLDEATVKALRERTASQNFSVN